MDNHVVLTSTKIAYLRIYSTKKVKNFSESVLAP